MFLLYAVPGAWIPLLSARLEALGFSPLEIGLCCASQAMASLIAPLVAGQVADRWIPAERCIAFCAAVGGGLLWILAELDNPWAVFWVSLAFWLVMVPAITLGVALSFTHLPNPERDYGAVRMWGTVGWVVPGWLLGLWFSDPEWLSKVLEWLGAGQSGSELADCFRLGGIVAWILAAYAVTLPHTPPQHKARHWLAPLQAMQLLRYRNFAVYCTVALGLCITIPFHSQVTPLF